MNLDISQELLGGLLGGGVAGAIIAGLIAVTTQARLFRREDRYRFNEVKREKYAELYLAAEEWLRAIHDCWFVLIVAAQGPTTGRAVVTLPGEPTRIKTLCQEVRLLGDRAVEGAAMTLSVRVLQVELFRLVIAQDPDAAPVGPGPDRDIWGNTMGDAKTALAAFFEAARLDLGTERPGVVSGSIRRLRRQLRRRRRP